MNFNFPSEIHIHVHHHHEPDIRSANNLKFLSQQLDSLNIKISNMAKKTEQEWNAVISKIDASTTQVAGIIQSLRTEVAGMGLGGDVEERLFSKFDEAASKLQAIGTTNPDGTVNTGEGTGTGSGSGTPATGSVGGSLNPGGPAPIDPSVGTAGTGVEPGSTVTGSGTTDNGTPAGSPTV